MTCGSGSSLAMLYITHDIASARYFADEILVMYAGQIVERGPAEELTQRPAHPYTQLLVASAPDPDNLGSTLRAGGRARSTRPAAPVPGSHPAARSARVPVRRRPVPRRRTRRCSQYRRCDRPPAGASMSRRLALAQAKKAGCDQPAALDGPLTFAFTVSRRKA